MTKHKVSEVSHLKTKTKPKPLLVSGETLHLNDKGEGVISTKQGELVVAGALPGDQVEVLVGTSRRKRRRKKSFLQKVISTPWTRITPFCSHFDLCGGCNRQDISYDNQLEIKAQLVYGLLSPLVGEEHPQLHEPLTILACDKPTFYRNRMDYSIGAHKWLERPAHLDNETAETTQKENSEKEKIEKIDMRGTGLHVKGLHDRVIHLDKCYLQESNAIRNTLHEWGIEYNIEFYNTRNKTGWLKGLTVRTTLTKQTMLIIEVVEEKATTIEQLSQHLTKQHPEITSIYFVINAEKKESIIGLPNQLVYGENFIQEQCGLIKLNIYPEVFYQTNSAQAIKLYECVDQFIGLGKMNETKQENELSILDLYCGIGSIGLFLAGNHPQLKITGVDVIERSIIAARENAEVNQLTNTNFHTGSVENLVDDDVLKGSYDWIILDPPRAGLHPKVIDYLNQLEKKCNLIYISCNPFTLAKDIKTLNQYQLEQWQPVDMFPHTHHVETVTKLIPKK